MLSSPSTTLSGARQRRDKSSKKSREAKRDSQKSTKSTARVVKIETDENAETQSASNPNRGIFERYMRQEVSEPSREERVVLNNNLDHDARGAMKSGVTKTVAQQSVCSNTGGTQPAPPENCQNTPGAARSSNVSDVIVKIEGDLPQEMKEIRGSVQGPIDKIGQTGNIGQVELQNDGDVAVPQSSAKHGAANLQQVQNNDDSPREPPNQEEQSNAKSDKPIQDGASERDAGTSKCHEMRVADQPTISADTIDTTEKSHRKSEKKRKHKHSRKRSKSRDRSKSHKRRKGSETFVPNHRREYTESSSEEEQSPNAFDVEQARARIPKGCSVRHEEDQKKELKDGKKILKSKKFTKMMRSTLQDHQVTALSWMVMREKETPRQADGGIIGDEMGLGKTVTSLACIAANRLPRKDRQKSAQATLVVVPNRKVASQWLEEAKKHWHEEASSCVTIYTQKSDHVLKQYEKQWIVLATYGQVRNSLPDAKFMESLHDQYADDRDTLRREFKKKAQLLLRIKWFRVILDEGHGITRWNGRTLEACTRIQAKHRWVLSGTPILNKPIGEAKNLAQNDGIRYRRTDKKLPEFYSYATFICCEFLGTRRVFKNDYIVEDATNDDFDTLASILMYRRTADEKLKIPPTTHRELYVEISQEEQMICNAIQPFFDDREEKNKERKEKAKLPIFEEEGDEYEVEDAKPEEDEDLDQNDKEPNIQASRQLRLRQALSHPYCLEKFLMGDYLSEDELRSLASDLKSMGEKKTIIEQLEEGEDWAEHLGRYQTGLDILKVRKEAFLGGVFDMSEIMDLVILQRAINTQKCGGSVCESQNLSRFQCGHMYCGQCLGDLMTQRSNLSEEERSGHIKCSADGCGEELLFGQRVTTLAQLASRTSKDKGYVEIGRDSLKTTVQARLEKSPFFIASSCGPRIVPPPSSRLTATMAVVMTWRAEAPQDKIIIFTQFIPTLKMLGYQLQTLGIKFVYYSGAMPKQKQEDSMNAFHNDPETMVMVATMKSGGQSHNLTVANRVIIVDLWWNKTAEKQAISRVARMGQKKETFSVRIVTRHSMDDRVIEVQTDKEAMVARMLQDDGHERIEVDDERLEQIFEKKEGEEARSKKRKRKEEPPEESVSFGMAASDSE
ncbi:SNF2 family N-terminal domain-containing protein [Trichoderma compactum]